MKQVIEQIKQSIVQYKEKGDMFRLPAIDRKDVRVAENELEPTGSLLYQCEYTIDFDNGDWIHIEYASKDRMRTFQYNPDRSVVEVKFSDSTLDFFDAWDERV